MVNSSNKVLTIDQRIVKDLNELNTMGEIQDAKKLDGLIKAKVGQTSFATKALPGYYAGNRDAKTVMVMLNPGVDVDKANGNLMADIQKRSMKDVEDLDNYHKWSVNYGHEDKGRKDVFKKYNEKYPGSVEFKRNNNEWKPFRGDSKPGHCIGLIITHNGKKMKALIANTFPRQDLQNAYDLMEAYGEFCYNEYIKL